MKKTTIALTLTTLMSLPVMANVHTQGDWQGEVNIDENFNGSITINCTGSGNVAGNACSGDITIGGGGDDDIITSHDGRPVWDANQDGAVNQADGDRYLATANDLTSLEDNLQYGIDKGDSFEEFLDKLNNPEVGTIQGNANAIENIQENLSNRPEVEVLVDNGNAYAATITNSEGKTIEVLDRAATDQLIIQDIAQHEALYGDGDKKEGVVNTANRLDNQLNGDDGIVDQIIDLGDKKADKTQVAEDIKNAVDDSLTTSKEYTDTKTQEAKNYAQEAADTAESKAKSYADTKVKDEAKIREDADKELSKSIVANHEYTQEQVGRLDEYNTNQDARMTKAEQELYSTTARSISNEKRLSAVEGRVSSIESDIAGMKKGMAAITAMSNLVEPKYAGDTTVSVGVGYAQSETAIALGLTHNFSSNVAGKVAVGSDTQFDEVVASGSIGWSF